MEKPVNKIAWLVLAGMFLFAAPPAPAQANHDCIGSVADWTAAGSLRKKAPDFRIDPKFTAAERAFIRKAVVTAVDRIQDREIWRQASESYAFAHPKAEAIHSAGFCNSADVQRNLLFHQLFHLANPSAPGTPGRFPRITIQHSNTPPGKDRPGWVGYAYYNKVRIYWNYEKDNWDREGDFQLYLNQYYLRQDGIYQSEDYWAGTVVHEMLHNLGHQHPDVTDATYGSFQINVLADIVRRQGFDASAGDVGFPVHTCRSVSSGDATAQDS